MAVRWGAHGALVPGDTIAEIMTDVQLLYGEPIETRLQEQTETKRHRVREGNTLLISVAVHAFEFLLS